MSETNSNTLTAHPGAILKAAREELSMSVSDAADALHLRSKIVEQIESGRYDEFESHVFLRGYFRSYCRLVNLHEERMVELLDALLESRETEERALRDKAREAQIAGKRQRLLRRASVIVTLLAVILTSIWLVFGSLTTSTQVETNEIADVMPELASVDNTNANAQEADAESEPSVEESAQLVDREESSELVVNDDENFGEVDDATDSEISVASAPESSLDTSPDGSQAKDSLASQSDTPGSALVVSENGFETGLIEIEFTGDCWVSLKNGLGKTPVASLKRDGDTLRYEGALPFTLILGDANVASVRFQEQPLDISADIRRNGRAEIRLGLE